MRLTADTNVLVRMVLGDHPEQSRVATETLTGADSVAVPLLALCEFAWVLRRGYKREVREIAAAIRRLIDSATVETDRPAVEAGLALLEAGGDFADGIIGFEGARLGGDTFVSFDADAVKRLKSAGANARLL